MSKKIKNINVYGCIEYDAGYNTLHDIDEIIDQLKKIKDEGATHINFSGYSCDGFVEEIEIQPKLQRLETDEEHIERIAKEDHLKTQREAIDRATYERLKQKYEN